jgi:putative phosphoribosyl transferase
MSELHTISQAAWVCDVRIPAGEATLEGNLHLPTNASGIVLFAHGSGSSRYSPRNQYVAQVIRAAGIGTLLFDLLTPEEEVIDLRTKYLRFDIRRLAERLEDATAWVAHADATRQLRIGYFGASTGGGAALVAAARLGETIGAVVSRGGRPDLAGVALAHVLAPTLLIVGGHDDVVIRLNEAAYAQLQCEKALQVVPGATHLFEEPGALEEVARRATAWFQQHLQHKGSRESKPRSVLNTLRKRRRGTRAGLRQVSGWLSS